MQPENLQQQLLGKLSYQLCYIGSEIACPPLPELLTTCLPEQFYQKFRSLFKTFSSLLALSLKLCPALCQKIINSSQVLSSAVAWAISVATSDLCLQPRSHAFPKCFSSPILLLIDTLAPRATSDPVLVILAPASFHLSLQDKRFQNRVDFVKPSLEFPGMAVAAVALSGLFRRPTISEGALSSSQPSYEARLHQNTPPGDLPLRRRGTQIASGDSLNPSPWQTRRGRRRRASKKWNQKKTDSEFDLVIVPADGISMSGSDSEDSDWSVGWFEPHHSDFTDNELEDSFAVLVPCYGSPTPQLGGAARSPFQFEEPKSLPWDNILASLSRQTHEGTLTTQSSCLTIWEVWFLL